MIQVQDRWSGSAQSKATTGGNLESDNEPKRALGIIWTQMGMVPSLNAPLQGARV